MNLGAAIFGLFCVFVIGAGVFYIVGTASSQPTYTDTYGSTQSPVTNATINASGNVTAVGESSIAPLLLIVAIIVICTVIFLLHLASKMFL